MKPFTSSIVSIIIPLFASCAQKWDSAQKAALTTIAVPSPAIAGDAYQKPIGKMPTAPVATVVVPPGGSFATGAVGGAIGQLIVEGIGAAQQSMYEKANAEAISRVSGTIPRDLSERIRKAVAKELDSNTFFRGRVRDASENRLVVKVDSYGYVRTCKIEGKIHMSPQFAGSFELTDAGGKSLLKQVFTGGAASESHPLEDFANNPKLAAAAFDAAIAYLASQISTAVNHKAN